VEPFRAVFLTITAMLAVATLAFLLLPRAHENAGLATAQP
jgi:hypothetical protein